MVTRVPCIIMLGQSNMEGQAPLTAIDLLTWFRWTGQIGITVTTSLPSNLTCPGIYFYTPKMPYGVADTRNITGSDATHVTIDGAAVPATIDDSWIYIKTATVGQGQLRKVVAHVGNILQVAAWTAPSVGGTVEWWTDSHTLAGGQTATVLTKSATTPALGAGVYAGKWLTVISGTAILASSRITTNTALTITLEKPLGVVPAALDGIRILSGTGSADKIDTLDQSNSSFRSLTFAYDQSLTYSDGYAYPNFKSTPLRAPTLHLAGPTFGPELEASWQIQHAISTDLFVIKLAVNAAALSRYRTTTGSVDFSWFEDLLHNDWHPGSTDLLTTVPTYDLFDVLMTKMLPAADAWLQANRSGSRLDVIGVLTMEGETEGTDTYRAQLAGANMKLVRDTMRTRLEAGGWTQKSAPRIPWIIGGVRTTSGTWIYGTSVNTQFQQLANDDPYTGFVDTNALTVIAGDVHYDAPSQITFGKGLAEKFISILTRESSAAPPDDSRETLGSIKLKVIRRYQGGDSSNDATPNRTVQFINDSLRDIRTDLGSLCWWLRRQEDVTINAPPASTALPAIISKLDELWRVGFPKLPINWELATTSQQGHVEIVATDGYSGNATAVHWVLPKDLIEDGDPVLLPMEYSELLVVLVCKRLCETTGNATMAQYYSLELDGDGRMRKGLWAKVRRDCKRFEAMRTGALLGRRKPFYYNTIADVDEIN